MSKPYEIADYPLSAVSNAFIIQNYSSKYLAAFIYSMTIGNLRSNLHWFDVIDINQILLFLISERISETQNIQVSKENGNKSQF